MHLLLLLRRGLFLEVVDRRGEPRFLVGCYGEGAVDFLIRQFGNRQTSAYSIMNIAQAIDTIF